VKKNRYAANDPIWNAHVTERAVNPAQLLEQLIHV
jgi:hypothetical protein